MASTAPILINADHNSETEGSATGLTWRGQRPEVWHGLPVHARQRNVNRGRLRLCEQLSLLLPHLILQCGVAAVLLWLLRHCGRHAQRTAADGLPVRQIERLGVYWCRVLVQIR